MDILFVAARFPYPPLKGDQVRAYHQLRLLGERHRITLVSFGDRKSLPAAYEHIRPFCAKIVQVPWDRHQAGVGLLHGLVSPLPLQVTLYQHAAMRRAIGQILSSQRFDLAHVQLARMAPYLQCTAGLPRMIDLIDALSLNMERRYHRDRSPLRFPAYVEWKRLQRYEQAICRSFDQVAVVSPVDRAAIGDFANLHVIPIGVDVARFSFMAAGRQKNMLVFSGNMAYFPNVNAVLWFARQVWPLVKVAIPDVRFVIVGTNPHPQVRALARHDPAITVTGHVPALQPFLAKATVAVVPMQAGSGVQFKALEAMACGAPIVATSPVLGGIAATPGEHLLLANEPRDFADQVLRLLRDPVLAQRLAVAARQLVEDRYTWEQSVASFERVYADCLS